jgi:hypothetical protein
MNTYKMIYIYVLISILLIVCIFFTIIKKRSVHETFVDYDDVEINEDKVKYIKETILNIRKTISDNLYTIKDNMCKSKSSFKFDPNNFELRDNILIMKSKKYPSNYSSVDNTCIPQSEELTMNLNCDQYINCFDENNNMIYEKGSNMTLDDNTQACSFPNCISYCKYIDNNCFNLSNDKFVKQIVLSNCINTENNVSLDTLSCVSKDVVNCPDKYGYSTKNNIIVKHKYDKEIQDDTCIYTKTSNIIFNTNEDALLGKKCKNNEVNKQCYIENSNGLFNSITNNLNSNCTYEHEICFSELSDINCKQSKTLYSLYNGHFTTSNNYIFNISSNIIFSKMFINESNNIGECMFNTDSSNNESELYEYNDMRCEYSRCYDESRCNMLYKSGDVIDGLCVINDCYDNIIL